MNKEEMFKYGIELEHRLGRLQKEIIELKKELKHKDDLLYKQAMEIKRLNNTSYPQPNY